MSDDLLARLREAVQTERSGKPKYYGFTPEQMQRGLERLFTAMPDDAQSYRAAMLDAFFQGAKDG